MVPRADSQLTQAGSGFDHVSRECHPTQREPHLRSIAADTSEVEEAEDVAAAVDRADHDKWVWGSRVVWWESSYTWSKPELACGSWESEPEWHRNARSEEADARWNRDTVASWAASAKKHSTCPISSYHSDNEAHTVSD